MSRAPGNPTCWGVTSRHSKSRISRRLRLRSRVSARVWGVGRGGKFPWRQQRRQGLNQFFLVFFDRQHVVSPAFEEDLLRGLDLRMERVGQGRLLGQWQLAQKCSGSGDLVAALFDRHGAQPAALAVDGTYQFHVRVPERFTIHNDPSAAPRVVAATKTVPAPARPRPRPAGRCERA